MAKAGRGSDQFVVRLPPGMRDKIAEVAERNGRSMNAEIVSILESSLKVESEYGPLDEVIGEIWNAIESLQREVNAIGKGDDYWNDRD